MTGRYFLVERYAPAGTAVAAAAQRLTGIRHVCSVVIAAEEMCLSVFEADDVATVREANQEADRIVEITWFPGTLP